MTSLDSATVMRNVQALARDFTRQRQERQRRRELDPADFDAIRETGFHLACLPEEEGGLWHNRARSTRLLCQLLRTLASADSSVALVAAMHPAVLMTARWLDRATPPKPYRAAWAAQQEWVFSTVRKGAWWGTIMSESGTGGDVRKTRATARRISPLDAEYLISGDKHFGSGSGQAAYMITSALPEGEHEPDIFFIDMRGVPWDGSAGVRLVAAWDGHGMTATQSHAFHFDEFPARRLAWPAPDRTQDRAGLGAGGAFFSSVIVGIVDAALAAARRQLADRRAAMGAYELIEWSRVEIDAWLVQQAYEGLLSAVEADSHVLMTGRIAKLAIAELAESALTRICRVVGGSSYGRYSPFGFWLEDVRALGFLRPPWAMMHESLTELIWSDDSAR